MDGLGEGARSNVNMDKVSRLFIMASPQARKRTSPQGHLAAAPTQGSESIRCCETLDVLRADDGMRSSWTGLPRLKGARDVGTWRHSGKLYFGI